MAVCLLAGFKSSGIGKMLLSDVSIKVMHITFTFPSVFVANYYGKKNHTKIAYLFAYGIR